MMTTGYRLATVRTNGQLRAAVIVGGTVFDAARVLQHGRSSADGDIVTMNDVLEEWPRCEQAFAAFAEADSPVRAEVEARALDVNDLAAPLMPGTIFCAGANYKDHVLEMSRAFNLPPEPDPHEIGLRAWHFVKPAGNCVRGPGDAIELPRWANFVDWEAEIAVVVGRKARNVAVVDAMRHVAGFTIVNDLSARDQFIRKGVHETSPFRYDWISQKCFDGAMPIGPWITPVAYTCDPSNMRIKLWVNDELMQDSSSNQLIFDMAEQVSHLSERLTLRPGDVIATGTPAGCGLPRGRSLRPGDSVRIWVESIGELCHTVV